ncbi:MAG: hypothetical protein NC184_02505 [Roseburia sp.]|nr:hypothetical protein [Roseburia sp.]
MSFLSANEIIAQRVFNPLYIILDSVFIVLLLSALVVKKRYMTVLFSIFGGVLYMIVDYGIFHLALHTRSIEGGSMFWVLLWMSMSYGITNFALIWIWVSKDRYYIEYTAAIWIWWICCPIIASMGGDATIKIQRTTGAYHGFMAVFMCVSYFALIVYNLLQKDKDKRFNIVWLFALGILVQLGWEVGLLIGGIRSAEFDVFQKLMTLVTNSLIETNLGLPALYCIYLLLSSRRNEDLTKHDARQTFTERLKSNNAERYRKDKNI